MVKRMSRREILVGAAVAASASAGPGVIAQEDPFLRFNRTGRYLELRRAFEGMGELHRQISAMVGDERSAFAGENPVEGEGVAVANDAKMVPAVPAIVALAADRRIVMINEAHNCSRHRHLLAEVLRELRPLGFTHLAAETFMNAGPEYPSIRNFSARDPLSLEVGHYTKDPVYAEAVREAAELGYEFVPYEQTMKQSEAGQGGPIGAREDAQARNLSGFLDAHPKARVVVFAGYGHIHEDPDFVFAARLKTLTGSDPLTVSQTALGSWGPHGGDGPITRELIEARSPTAPVMFKLDEQFVGSDRVDALILHPSIPDVGARPAWLARDPHRHQVTVELPGSLREPALVQILHRGDPEVCVPADQYLLNTPSRTATFHVRQGDYRARAETAEGYVELGSISV